ncbi:MAG: hypothetical protein JWQ07_5099 [Ramlibacter sp.]|nr:hypothetical protein [Ramlibacter sp.]
MIGQQDALQILDSHAEALYSIPMEAWDQYHAETPQSLLVHYCARTRASAVHNLMVANAARYVAKCGNAVQMFERRQMVGLAIDGLAIRFKKADEDSRSKNQPTLQVQRFRNQVPVIGVPATHNLELVYVLNEHETEMLEVRVAHPSGDNIAWWFRLRGGRAEPGVFDIFQPQPHAPIAPAKIGPKKTGEVIPLRKEDGNKDDKS